MRVGACLKLRPSIAAARAVPVAARAVATRRSSHAAVAVSEHRLHPPAARYAHGTVVEPHSQLVFTSGARHSQGGRFGVGEDKHALRRNVLEILRAAGANEKMLCASTHLYRIATICQRT